MNCLVKRKKKQIGIRECVLLGAILLIGFGVSVYTSDFLQISNVLSIVNNNAIYGILALGMTLIMSLGHIDISVGAQFAIVGIIVAKISLMMEEGNPLFLLFIALLAGGVLGGINSTMVMALNLPTVIVTLAMLNIFRGATYLITKGEWITMLPKWYTNITNIQVIGIKITTITWGILIILFILIFKYLNIGKKILAVGDNCEYAKKIGINVRRVNKIVFVVWGMLIGLAAFFFVAQIGTIQPSAGSGYEMTLVAAAIIGGNFLTGGEFKCLGTALGILLLGLINNVLVLAHISMYWQNLITGLTILGAIVIAIVMEKRMR